MKTLGCIFFIMANFLVAQGQTFDSVLEYMNHIGEQYGQISEQSWDYTSAVARGKKAKKIEGERQELLKTIKLAEIKMKKLSDYEGDFEYRDKVLEYFSLSYLVLKEDYGEILDMEEIAEQSYDLMEAYLFAQDEADRKMEDAIKLVTDEQNRFAKEHDIDLIDTNTETGQKMELAGAVFDYYKKVYLVFFKSFKNDMYLTDAISRLDLNAIEQNMESAKLFVEEGENKLNEYGDFNSDASLSSACKDLLEFYTKDTKENRISDFILLQQKVQAKTELMEDKKKSEITQKDIDEYNELITELNSFSEDLNDYSQSSFKEKSALVDSWNKSVAKFLDKHTPK